MNLKIDLPNEKATKSLGLKIAQSLPSVISDMTVVLKGEMGAGKSTVVRSVLRGMGYRNIVPSPTYTLVEPYEVQSGKIYHIDLYRISNPDELEFLGWSDLNDGLKFIEWPERVPLLFEQADLILNLEYISSGRTLEFNSRTKKGDDIVQKVYISG
ncbi:MAG: tRNA (adenosine(37)-N6)-threonylcarbamoyltransferase complex ATPase subunit type 1 TsaE [Woeseiaceae bacterium]|jgi:tRNA threonylcarbamoyladenosine biosynthesis protein TsaE|nr:tRNA (adenosine(37)-N6)-threonylcarbamoyltransferase complex ATPase subunit type 1 TsaE [Woeseiaceae bacterium]MDG1015282.1 tRNA (adenosine(37)-N6)-threonylcarbamoyltransferase complex ATPase subunit type 1 TsaE [Woeseiaceae bacterium]MDG1712609.1 tRNA (adenosine(37)-N6)-threonylcarbamoyltransferase complex ATPase subunit type 1 TsaE [Woeseiaceae bacterium]